MDLSRVHIWDESGIEALNSLFDIFEKNKTSVQIIGIKTTDKELINK
nr:STAS domain-containing protein [Enterococcus italicus]